MIITSARGGCAHSLDARLLAFPQPPCQRFVNERPKRAGPRSRLEKDSPYVVGNISASKGDGLWTATDAELIAMATDEAMQIGLVDAEDVVDACVVRQPKAYPIYTGATAITWRRSVTTLKPTIRVCISLVAACIIQQSRSCHDDGGPHGAKHPLWRTDRRRVVLAPWPANVWCRDGSCSVA
jgi:hypothetical protein